MLSWYYVSLDWILWGVFVNSRRIWHKDLQQFWSQNRVQNGTSKVYHMNFYCTSYFWNVKIRTDGRFKQTFWKSSSGESVLMNLWCFYYTYPVAVKKTYLWLFALTAINCVNQTCWRVSLAEYLLHALKSTWLQAVFQIFLLGTLWGTQIPKRLQIMAESILPGATLFLCGRSESFQTNHFHKPAVKADYRCDHIQ